MITIDLRWVNTSGMGTYLRNIIPNFLLAFPSENFCLLGNTALLLKLPWTNRSNVRIVECNAPMYSIAEQFELFRAIPSETTLFWSTHYNIPLLYRGKMLVTVYDLFHLAMPKLVGGWYRRLYAKFMFTMVLRRALVILTISHFSKNELRRFCGPLSTPTHPIHLGVSSSWFDIKPSTRPYENAYVLFVGNVKPHKNLSALVTAFNLICSYIPHDLVIVGKREGFITGDSVAAELASRMGSRVHFTGYLDEVALHQYLAHAEAMVFPSLYEGFGLPPLEAMAAGCPVLVSDAGPMPEVCGDAALYCDPYSADDMAAKLLTILTDEPLRVKLRERGLKHARTFTWDKCVAQTCKVIRELLDEPSGKAS
jgi:glycosyltransferase involved in cell wall biosynthesis